MYTMIMVRPLAKPTSVKVGDLEIGDVDDFEDELNGVQLQPTSKVSQRKQMKQLDSKPIDTHTAIVSWHLLFVFLRTITLIPIYHL